MELDLFKNVLNKIKNVNVNEFIKEISERLEKMEEVLVIDRFERSLAICEDRKTNKMIEIERKDLPFNIKEGDFIKMENGKYILEEELQEETKKRIEDKMNSIWKN